MKTVFSNSELAHVWANKQQNEGRTSIGSFFFSGDKIYSYGYHYLIAKHEGEAVLFTNRSYSKTTHKQTLIVRQALNGMTLIFCHKPDGVSHNENFVSWFNNMQDTAANLVSARKPEKYLNIISQIFGEVEKYAKFFNLEIPGNIIELSNLQNADQYKELETKRAAAEQKAADERNAKIKKDIKITLAKWRSFKTPRLYVHNGLDYLRFNKEKNRVETSQAVEIPATIAKDFYTHILDTLKNGGCTDCNTKLLAYDVKEINKDFIVVGCHKIQMSEIKKTIKLLV